MAGRITIKHSWVTERPKGHPISLLSDKYHCFLPRCSIQVIEERLPITDESSFFFTLFSTTSRTPCKMALRYQIPLLHLLTDTSEYPSTNQCTNQIYSPVPPTTIRSSWNSCREFLHNILYIFYLFLSFFFFHPFPPYQYRH